MLVQFTVNFRLELLMLVCSTAIFLAGCRATIDSVKENQITVTTLSIKDEPVTATSIFVKPTATLVNTSTFTSVPPAVTHTPIPPTLTPKPSTSTPMPTIDPFPTPTIESVTILISSQINEPACAQSDTLEESGIGVVFNPFCIVWVDFYDDETGFQIQLDYFNESKQFVFEVKEDTTLLVVPEEFAPQSHESFEKCFQRKDIAIAVFALKDSSKTRIRGVEIISECNINDYKSD